MILQEIITGVILFTGIVVILAILIVLVRSQLFPTGHVTVQVNDRLSLDVSAGEPLLSVLAANEIYIPSACGGGGSCGQCRLQIIEGGGDILPIESSHITRREANEGLRLACQVTTDQNMRIHIADTLLDIKRIQCRVRSNKHVSAFIKELVLEIPEKETLDFRAGEFVIIESPAYQLYFSDLDIPTLYRGDWDRLGLNQLESKSETVTQRAYSLANYPAERGIILLNVRIAIPPPTQPLGTPPGIVSSFIFSLKPNDTVSVKGPFGDFFVKQTDAEMIFIGGGVGMAPMRSHILNQLKSHKTKRTISFWYGARNLRDAFYIDIFEQLALEHKNFNFHLALSDPLPEDNWSGNTGFIHEVLMEEYLNTHPTPEDCEFYLCGPPMMITALAHMLDELGVEKENILFDDFGG